MFVSVVLFSGLFGSLTPADARSPQAKPSAPTAPAVNLASAKAPTLHISPATPVRNRIFVVHGWIGNDKPRPIELQMKVKGKWRKVVGGSTYGGFADQNFHLRMSTNQTRADVRVVAKRVKIKKHTYARIVSKVSSVTTVDAPRQQAAALAAGRWSNCALTRTRTVQCWGANDRGQLGTGKTAPLTDYVESLPVDVVGLTDVVSLSMAADQDRSCAATSSGEVWCWGDGHALPAKTEGVSGAAQIALGRVGACALIHDGTVKCWGSGLLGNGVWSDHSGPITVSGITDAVQVAAGEGSFCARLGDGTVRCWGAGEGGQLGNGGTQDSAVPVTVSGVTNATAIAAADTASNPDVVGPAYRYGHACAVIADGTVRCWGGNSKGELGDQNPKSRVATPVAVAGLTGVTAIAVGAEWNTCASTTSGSVYCWGSVADGTTANRATLKPTQIKGLSSIHTLAIGNGVTCAATAGGTTKCWGQDSFGQLGSNDRFVDKSWDHYIPVGVLGFS
jgi:hypothetical protein